MARIAELMGAESGTEASRDLEILIAIVDAYESIHFPMNKLDPETLRNFEMEQQVIIG